VFHVSQLKVFHGEPPTAPPLLPEVHHGKVVPTPLKALKVRLSRGARQILVQWTDSAASEASWEDLTEFQKTYPTFQLEDELLVEGGSDVMWGKHYSRRAKPKAGAVEES
jgi:hypothetical protein